MFNLDRLAPFGGRRLVAATVSVVTLSAALATVYAVRARASHHTPSTAEAFAVPAGAPSPTVTATSSVSCDPGTTGPLRMDTRFTADDGKGTPVPFSVSLPEDYYTACTSYPVIYALHGKTQDNVSFLGEAVSMRRAMAAGALRQAIIVTPDSYSTGRWENRETGPAEDNLIKYLIPHIEQTYRVVPGPEHRLLVGFSMGGHGALRFALKYPRMFAATWSVDGAMSGGESYLPFVQGHAGHDYRIIAVGGRLNGDRVQRLVDALGADGVTVPYVYQDLDHRFVDFVAEDGRTGWYAMKYLDHHLGRPV